MYQFMSVLLFQSVHDRFACIPRALVGFPRALPWAMISLGFQPVFCVFGVMISVGFRFVFRMFGMMIPVGFQPGVLVTMSLLGLQLGCQ